MLTYRDRAQAMDLLGALTENVVLSAGFPWIIDETTLGAMTSIKLNSHPSLLPDFPGRDAIRDAVREGASHLGVTVHRMVPEVDSGPIIVQEAVEVRGLELPDVYQLLFRVVEPRVVVRALRSIRAEIADHYRH